MSRMKLVVLSLVAAFALSAVASSTALATHEFKVEGKTIASGSNVEVQGQIIELGQLEGTLGKSVNIHITCNDALGPASAKNVLESGGKAKLFAEFKGCSVYEVNKGGPVNLEACKVKEITAEANGETTAEAGTIKFEGSGTGKSFGKVVIGKVAGSSESCSVEGEVEVTGSQLCDIPSYAFEGDIGELICTGTGSKELQLNKASAKIYARLAVAPTNGQKLGQT
jgi:hypothetical protein